MNYAAKLARLRHLSDLVERYLPMIHSGGEEGVRLHKEICEVYGEVADVFDEVLGKQTVQVPQRGSAGTSTYPNFFEAGFLSGRTIHSYQGKTELLKVIGRVGQKVDGLGAVPIGRATLSSPERKGVFLVHGHDEATLHACARFVEKLGVIPTILREQPNQGRTIIEKFVDNSEVAFAVVLLTPDDRGASRDVPYEQQNYRARQNVILELGFFLGRLGRNRVCALYADGVEVPSDYHGVAFVRLDGGGAWKLELARELKAAGLPVDVNNAI